MAGRSRSRALFFLADGGVETLYDGRRKGGRYEFDPWPKEAFKRRLCVTDVLRRWVGSFLRPEVLGPHESSFRDQGSHL